MQSVMLQTHSHDGYHELVHKTDDTRTHACLAKDAIICQYRSESQELNFKIVFDVFRFSEIIKNRITFERSLGCLGFSWTEAHKAFFRLIGEHKWN